MAFPNLQHIDLKLLTALEILLEERHVGRAATRMNLSQSAMSRVLNRLRELFDDPLFIRTSTQMYPTTRALALEGPLKSTLEQLNNLFQQQCFTPATSERCFRIQTTNYQAQAYIPAVAEAFYQAAPNAQLDIVALQENSLLNQPMNTSDLVLCSGQYNVPPGFHRKHLGRESFRCIMAKNHPLANKDTLTLDDYLNYRHVLVKLGGGSHILSDAVLGEHQGRRKFGFTTPFYICALETVGRTQLLFSSTAMLPERFAEQFGVVSKTLPLEFPQPNYYLAWAENVHNDPGLIWLRGLCFETILGVIPFPG